MSCANQIPVFPTASPFVVSVGGTMWLDDAGAQPTTWSANGAYGSGGGFSRQFAMPAHQRAAVAAYLESAAGLPDARGYNA